MEIHDSAVVLSQGGWADRVNELQATLKDLRPQVVAAEQQLSEKLVEISAFEFLVRARLEPLNRRLNKITDEIDELNRSLRSLRENYLNEEGFEADGLYRAWRYSEEAGPAAGGDFRYHEPQNVRERPRLNEQDSEELKDLYRQLARRFHPDFALDEADRAYRTQVMIAINAAYSASDAGHLRELLRQPDPKRRDYTLEDLAAALLREVEHCRFRINEIEQELNRLLRHPSYLLKMRVDKAAASGRDLLEELAADLRDRIAGRLAQREVLLAEIEAVENGESDFTDDIFADAVFNLGLEHILDEDGDNGVSEWRDRNRTRLEAEEPDDEEVWEALRRLRNKRR